MLHGDVQSVVLWLGCFGFAPLLWYHCGSLYGMSKFYSSLYPSKPAELFIAGNVTWRSGIYDLSESIGEGVLCAGVRAGGDCCYRIAMMRRHTVRWSCCF